MSIRSKIDETQNLGIIKAGGRISLIELVEIIDSVYENEFLSHNIQGLLWDNRGDELYVDYRYEKKAKETEIKEDIQSIFGKINIILFHYFYTSKCSKICNLASNQ